MTALDLLIKGDTFKALEHLEILQIFWIRLLLFSISNIFKSKSDIHISKTDALFEIIFELEIQV